MEVFLTFAVGILAVSVSYQGYRISRPKIKAETEQMRVGTALSLIGPLEDRVKHLELEMHELHEGIELLILQLQENGHTPVWVPGPSSR